MFKNNNINNFNVAKRCMSNIASQTAIESKVLLPLPQLDQAAPRDLWPMAPTNNEVQLVIELVKTGKIRRLNR